MTEKENIDYSKKLCQRISTLRRQAGLTQEALAEQLGISFQAVSKWENMQSCPDIAFLPILAEIFEVKIDSLFGITTEPLLNNSHIGADINSLDDDEALRAVLLKGNKIVAKTEIEHQAIATTIKFVYEGKALNIHSDFSVYCNCDEINGNITAGDSVICKGNVQGDISAGDQVECQNVGGNVSAGDSVNCGDIEGNASAGDSINCGNIGRTASAGDNINCGNINGNVSAGERVNCGNVEGCVESEGDIACSDIHGDVRCEGNLKCLSISGNVCCEGDITYIKRI